jgi:hypothetical protein
VQVAIAKERKPMRNQWGRAGAVMRLLAAIFSDLGRRTWWAYRARGLHTPMPRTTIVAPRPADRQTYVPVVTETWRPVVAGALPVQAAARLTRPQSTALPVVWIDVTDRPDIADLPRVIAAGRAASDSSPLAGTQWLADHAAHQTVLIVTFVEPVSCTWALRFDIPRRIGILERVAGAGQLLVAWDAPPATVDEDGEQDAVITATPARGLLLPITTTTQLRAILRMWAGRLAVE